MNAIQRVVLLVMVLAATVLAGCGGSGSPTPQTGVRNISGAELQGMIANNQQTVVLDVRSVPEFNDGHIDGSVNMPINPMADFLTAISGLDRNATIVVVCGVGARSRQAADVLVTQGFTNVYNLTGGLAAWDGGLVRDI